MASSLPFERPGSRPATPLVDANELLTALDGHDVTVSGRTWHVEVYSVSDGAGCRWIQLALEGPSHFMLTLRLAAGEGVQQAVLALSSWLVNPSDTSAILNVA